MKFLSRTLFEGGSLLRLPPDAGDVANDTGKDRVNIYPVEKQEILGFGGAFTESSAYTYAQLDAAGKAAAIDRKSTRLNSSH